MYYISDKAFLNKVSNLNEFKVHIITVDDINKILELSKIDLKKGITHRETAIIVKYISENAVIYFKSMFPNEEIVLMMNFGIIFQSYLQINILPLQENINHKGNNTKAKVIHSLNIVKPNYYYNKIYKNRIKIRRVKVIDDVDICDIDFYELLNRNGYIIEKNNGYYLYDYRYSKIKYYIEKNL